MQKVALTETAGVIQASKCYKYQQRMALCGREKYLSVSEILQ
jgi:hypothetical protein